MGDRSGGTQGADRRSAELQKVRRGSSSRQRDMSIVQKSESSPPELHIFPVTVSTTFQIGR